MSSDDFFPDVHEQIIDAAVTEGMQTQADVAQSLSARIQSLVARDREYGRQLLELRAIVDVLRDLIVQAGVDESMVRYRVEAAIDAAHAEADAVEETANSAVCASCQRRVPIGQTHITDLGTVCDRCA